MLLRATDKEAFEFALRGRALSPDRAVVVRCRVCSTRPTRSQQQDGRCPYLYLCSQFGPNPGNHGIERIKSSAARSISLVTRIQESRLGLLRPERERLLPGRATRMTGARRAISDSCQFRERKKMGGGLYFRSSSSDKSVMG